MHTQELVYRGANIRCGRAAGNRVRETLTQLYCRPGALVSAIDPPHYAVNPADLLLVTVTVSWISHFTAKPFPYCRAQYTNECTPLTNLLRGCGVIQSGFSCLTERRHSYYIRFIRSSKVILIAQKCHQPKWTENRCSSKTIQPRRNSKSLSWLPSYTLLRLKLGCADPCFCCWPHLPPYQNSIYCHHIVHSCIYRATTNSVSQNL